MATVKISKEIETLAKRNKEIKKVQTVIPWNENIEIIDYSLKSYGIKQEFSYLENEKFYKTIRKGTSLIKIYSKDNKVKGVSIARLGLRNFYDIDQTNIDFLMNPPKEEFPNIGKLSGKHRKIAYNRIFSSLEKSLQNGEEISVVRTRKLNGENFQISFNKTARGWVIGSKNVSILVRNRADINHYKQGHRRFQFANQIASLWFDTINGLSKEDIENLKEDLANYTLIGEYIGNKNFQLIIKYPKERLEFFACVDHLSEDTCLSPEEAFKFFEFYKLPSTEVKTKSGVRSLSEIHKILSDLTIEVKEKTLEQTEEGEVIYFISGDRVLSVGKIKSLEYQIFKKLKEKIKWVCNEKRKQTIDEVLADYLKDVSDLVSEERIKPPRPIQNYEEMGKLAIEFANTTQESPKYTILNFVSFLSVLKYCYYNGKDLSTELLDDSEKLKEIERISWDSYLNVSPPKREDNDDLKREEEEEDIDDDDEDEDDDDIDLEDSEVEDVKSEKEEIPRSSTPVKSRNKNLRKVEITPAKLNPVVIKQEQQLQALLHNSQQQKKKKFGDSHIRNLSIFLDVTAPGMGTPKFYEEFTKTLDAKKGSFDIRYKIIDSDHIKKTIIAKSKTKPGPELSEEALNAQFLNEYEQHVYNAIKDGIQIACDQFVLLIDHRYSLTSAPEEIEKIRVWLPENLNYKFFCVTYPSNVYKNHLSYPAVGGKQIVHPFSPFSILSGIQRISHIETSEPNPENLSPEVIANLNKFLSFVEFFKGVSIDSSTCQKVGFDHYIGFPFFSVIGDRVFEKREDRVELEALISKLFKERAEIPNPSLLKDSAIFREILRSLPNIDFSYELYDVPYNPQNFDGPTYYDVVINKAVDTLLKKTSVAMISLKKKRELNLRMKQRQEEGAKNNLKDGSVSRSKDFLKSRKKRNSFPLYMGYFAVHETNQKVMVTVVNFINMISSQSGDETIRLDLMDFLNKPKPKNWRIPRKHHVTSIFLKKKPPKTKIEKEVFRNFKFGVLMNVEIKAMAYVPGHIITGITQIDRSKYYCANKYDHVTLMNYGFSTKQSNDLLESLFAGGTYREFYDNGFRNLENIVETTIMIKNKNYPVFLIPLKPFLTFEAKSDAVY